MVSGFNFLIGILMARVLGPAEFGRFVLVLILAAMMGVFQEYFLTTPMMTLVGRRARRSASYFATVALLGVLTSIAAGIVVAIAIGAVFYFRDGAVSMSLVLAAMLATAMQNMHGIVRRVLFGQSRPREAFTLDLTRYLLLSGAALLVLQSRIHLSSEWMLLLRAGSALASSLISAPALFRAPVRLRLLTAVARRHWPIARWLVLMVVVSMGQEQLVPIIISYVLGDQAVGGLRASQYLLGVTHFILMAITNFLPQRASHAFETGGSAGLRAYLLRQTLMLGLPTLALILAIGIPGQYWLSVVFGPHYVEYTPVLRVFCFCYIAIFIRDLWAYYLTTIEQTRSIFTGFALSSAISLAMIIPAIKLGGVTGAAVVVLLAHLISMTYVLVQVARHSAPPKVA